MSPDSLAQARTGALKMREVVIVTGASRGIGAATVRLLGARGADVIVNYRTEQAAADAVVGDIKAAGGRALAVAADVGVEADVLRLFAETDRAFGALTGLVNNAGISGTATRRIEQLEFDTIMTMLRVNVAGALVCTREAVKRMSTRRGGQGGSIVNVSSVGALTGSPYTFIDYAASKGAVDTLTVGTATEVAKYGIRVNAVRPGMIDTEIHATAGMPDRVARFGSTMPMGRAGTAEEVAQTVVWLLSNDASYVTGAIVNVTGGLR